MVNRLWNATGRIVSTCLVSDPKNGGELTTPQNRVSGFGGKSHLFFKAKIVNNSNLRND